MVNGLHRQHRGAEQTVRIRLAIIRQPAVVRAAGGGGKFRILGGTKEQAEAGIKKRGVDSFGIHIRNTGVWIEAAALAFQIGNPKRIDPAGTSAEGTQTTE